MYWGNTWALVGNEHSYPIHLLICLASVIHFLKNGFQNVLMTSQLQAPRTRLCSLVTMQLSEAVYWQTEQVGALWQVSLGRIPNHHRAGLCPWRLVVRSRAAAEFLLQKSLPPAFLGSEDKKGLSPWEASRIDSLTTIWWEENNLQHSLEVQCD